MSRRIAAILQQPEHLVTKLINELEEKNGWPSQDVRFLAETIQKIRLRVSELGLDPDDTTSEELYHALLVKFEKSSRLFDLQTGLSGAGFDNKCAKAGSLVNQNFDLPQQWVLKNAAAKAVLRQLPPKHVMKQLHYRSLESMLKRENLAEVYLGAKYLESTSWQKAHGRLISRLDQMDFELRQLLICSLDYESWSDVQGPQDLIAYDDHTGAIALWPSEELKNAPLLSITLLLIEKIDSYKQIKQPNAAAKLSGLLEWWAGMDHLVAELGGEHVSLSLKDNAVNFLLKNDYRQRALDQGRQSFWRELLDRYENLPPTEAVFDNSIRQKIAGLKTAIPQPAYEFAEEFDG